MQTIRYTDTSGPLFDASVVTIGNFDGVHRGHQAVFARVAENASHMGLPCVAITFDPHPLAVMDPDRAPQLLSLFDEKERLIEQCGIDYLLCIPFTGEFSRVTAGDFVGKVLCGDLGLRHLVIGHDYAFGRNREGDFSFLENASRQYGFSLEDCDPVGEEGVVFSSSAARNLLLCGDVEGAEAVLGRRYSLSGRVVRGRNIGREIGFPTANITPGKGKLVPSDGVYAVLVDTGDTVCKGACTIGTNPTFGPNGRTIEVFLLDFTGDLYDYDITLVFAARIRDMMKFPDVASLIEKIGRDVSECRRILEGRG